VGGSEGGQGGQRGQGGGRALEGERGLSDDTIITATPSTTVKTTRTSDDQDTHKHSHEDAQDSPQEDLDSDGETCLGTRR